MLRGAYREGGEQSEDMNSRTRSIIDIGRVGETLGDVVDRLPLMSLREPGRVPTRLSSGHYIDPSNPSRTSLRLGR